MDPLNNSTADVSTQQRQALQQQSIDTFNRSLGRQTTQDIGQDTFLRLFIEQLKNQDPSKPVDNKEFIAQMAQFNSLEQMIALNKSFKKIESKLSQSQALSLLGKEVSVEIGRDRNGQALLNTGRVSAVHPGKPTNITIDKQQYPLSSVRKISP